MFPLRLRRRRRQSRPLQEAEAYARCHGDRGNDVRVLRLPPRRPRFAVLLTGEELRRRFEERLDRREAKAS
jgi:hypothetical protein